MKFTVNRKPFIKAINLAFEVAGKSLKKYDFEKYSHVTPYLVDEYEKVTKQSLQSAL